MPIHINGKTPGRASHQKITDPGIYTGLVVDPVPPANVCLCVCVHMHYFLTA